MDRLASTAAAMAAVALAVAAVMATMGGVADAGVEADYVDGVVRRVDPAGAAWRAGLRPGHRVLAVRAADEPGGWAIETAAGGVVLHVEIERENELLRSSMPVAFAAVAISVAGAIQLPRRRRLAEATAVLGILAAGFPLAVANDRLASGAALACAAILPSAWLARWLPLRWQLSASVLAACLAIAAAWLVARASGWAAFEGLEALRLAVAAAGTFAMIAALVEWGDVRPTMLVRPRLIDAASLLSVVALGTTLFLLGVPLLAIGGCIVLVVALYPTFRRSALRLLDRAFLAEQRERNTLAASEAERARLARELHDSPLQDLAGVIQRLEGVPGSDVERQTLREVAEQLRNVTTELHPPVLDDLGLVAAIEFVSDRIRGERAPVRVDVDDRTALAREHRPPEEVELAMFRIVQEAVANAVHHARASVITVSGFVARTEAELTVTDDGVGMGVAEEALRNGRLGLASMRRRAEAIGARLSIRDGVNGSGTAISVRWEADA